MFKSEGMAEMSIDEQKKRLIQDYRSKQHSYYAKGYATPTRQNFPRRLRNTLINNVLSDIEHCENVLDAGCGPAILYDDLLERTGTYHAVDLVETNLEEIRAKHGEKKIKYIQTDLDQFEWQSEYFSIIICSGSLEYTHDPARNLQKLIKLLKPGGTLIASFPNVRSPYRLWGEFVYNRVWYLRRKIMGEKAFLYRRKLLSGARIEKLCSAEAGVQTVSLTYFGHKLIPQPLDQVLGALDYRITRYLNERPFKCLGWAATEFLVVVRK
jgi:2-polyprenyl-3-methyl-5-hydroxy-6-metoxy-1,4-benzoquinol methylase